MTTSFESTLASLKRRLLVLGTARGAAWGAVIAFVLVLIAVWMDLLWELSPAARIVCLVVALVVAVVMVAISITQSVRASRAAAIARRLDEVGGTGGEILSGLDLTSFAPSGAQSVLSQGLAQIAVRRAAEAAARVPASLAASIQPLRRAVIAALAVVVSLAVIALTASRLTATEWLRFSDPFGDHPPYSRTILYVEPGPAKVRYGDGLDVIATVEGPPVEELELVLKHGADTSTGGASEILPMFPESPTRWKATLSSVTEPGTYVVRTRSARSHRYPIEVVTVPRIERVTFRITPPAYTRDAVYDGPLPKAGITGLPGTVVEVRAHSNRPLSGGVVEFAAGDRKETITLKPSGDQSSASEVVGSWALTSAGTFRLTIKDVAGQESRDSFSGPIVLLADQRPFVRVMEPPNQSLATPSAVVPVVTLAEDDYGISRLQLYRSLNDSRALPLSAPTADPPIRRQEGVASLLLPKYGVEPGDIIKLFARAEDNDPGGVKGSESPIAVIQIVSDEEFDQLLRTRDGIESMFSKYQEAQRRLEALQKELDELMQELEKKDAEETLSPEELQKLEQLSKKIAEEAEAVQKSADRPHPIDLDQALTRELQKLAQSMREAFEEAKQAAATPGLKAGQARKQLKKLQDQLGSEKQKLQEGVNDPLDQLAAIFPLVEDQARYLELNYRQRDLAERLKSLKDSENPDDPRAKIRMRELESEQHKIRQDLDDLLNDIESHATRLPEGSEEIEDLRASSLAFVRALRESDAEEAMNLAAEGLAEFSGRRGHEEATRAADILESFLSNCKNCSSQGEAACKGLKFSPGEGALGNSIEQILAAMGLKSGSSGDGAVGGYSARRSGLSNIGLYGQLPARSHSNSRSGQGSRAAAAGGSRQSGAPSDSSSPFLDSLSPSAGGATDAVVPAAYRRRVEKYFERIADEAVSAPKGTRP